MVKYSRRVFFALSLLVFILLFLPIATPLAHADIIKLRTGETYEGKVKMGGGADCEVRLRDGTIKRIPRSDIESIEEGPCSWEIFAEKAAACDYEDTDAIMALVELAREYGMWKEWRENLEKVIEIKPDHRDARFYLGFEKKDGGWVEIDLSGGEWSPEEYSRSGYIYDKRKRKWLTPDEAKRAAGLVLFRGEWKTKAEAMKVIAAEETENARLLRTMTAADLVGKTRATNLPVAERLRYTKLAIRKNPRYADAYNRWVYILLKYVGDLAQADMVVALMKKKFPESYLTYIAEVKCERVRCNFSKVVSLSRKAGKKSKKTGGSFWDWKFYLGSAYYYQNMFGEADEIFQEISIDAYKTGTLGGDVLACYVISLMIQGKLEEANRVLAESGWTGNELYYVRRAGYSREKDELRTCLSSYLDKADTTEQRDIRRRWLSIDPALESFRGDADILSLLKPEGVDSAGWSLNAVESEDISGKDIHKAAKKKRMIDMTGLVGQWGVLKTGHHILFSNSTRPRVVEIGNRLEMLSGELDRILGTKPKKGSEPILRIFRSRAEYLKYITNYYRTPTRSAYFIPGPDEAITWAPSVKDMGAVIGDILTSCVVQRLHADFGSPLPLWLTKGMELYFSTAKHDKKTFSFEVGVPHAQYHAIFKQNHPDPARAPDLAYFFTQTRPGLERTGDSGRAGRADLWGFMYFLMKSPDEKVRAILPGYFTALKEKKDRSEALKAIYKSYGMADLSSMMVEFINGL